MTSPFDANPEAMIRVHRTKKGIFKKIYQLLKNQPGLEEEQALHRMEAETAGLFDQLLSAHLFSAPPLDMAELQSKPWSRKRLTHRDRTEHVGRFFIHTLEKPLRQAGVNECVIPVLAQSIPLLIGDDVHLRFAEKINHLIAFADSKGFNYEQVLMSKPGKKIMDELLRLYRTELAGTPGFEIKLRNRLDEALVQYTADNPGDDFDIDEAVERSLGTILNLIRNAPPEKETSAG
ncbi:MAG: hypothetical protein ACE5ER_02475 [Nitrospinaceae bacterium]